MKHILYIFFGLLTLISCTSDKEKLQENIWMSKYGVSKFQTENEYTLPELLKFYTFTKDSLKLQHFLSKDNSEYQRLLTGFEYRIEDSLYIMTDNGIWSSDYKIYDDSLILLYGNNDTAISKRYLERMPIYNQSNNQLKLYDLLINNSFEVHDSINVEFSADRNLTCSNFYFLFEAGHKWRLETFRGELFLLIDSYLWYEPIHIKTISENSFSGILYGIENQTLNFNSNNSILFNNKHLIGEWKAIKGFSNAHHYDDKDIEFTPNEMLIITDSTINNRDWYMSRKQDLIFLSATKEYIYNEQYDIIELSDNNLIIERYCSEEENINCNRREIITFEKIK